MIGDQDRHQFIGRRRPTPARPVPHTYLLGRITQDSLNLPVEKLGRQHP